MCSSEEGPGPQEEGQAWAGAAGGRQPRRGRSSGRFRRGKESIFGIDLEERAAGVGKKSQVGKTEGERTER